METVDKGIDLILRLKDNSFRLIQVKYRHGENGVKDAGGAYKLLGRATQRVGVDRVKLIWLITNGKHPPHYNREYDLQTHDNPQENWSRALATRSTILSTLDWIYKNMLYDDTACVPIPLPMEPREWQRYFSEMCGLELSDRVDKAEQLKVVGIVPCAAGKSYGVFRVAVDAYQGNLLVLLAPSLPLCWQHTIQFHEYMIREKYHSDEFDFVAPIAVGSQEGMTLKTKDIDKYVKSARKNKNKMHVIISTYHSALKVLERTGKACMTCNDEAHVCSGKRTKPAARAILENRSEFIVSVTATMRKVSDNVDEKIKAQTISMTDVDVFGEEILLNPNGDGDPRRINADDAVKFGFNVPLQVEVFSMKSLDCVSKFLGRQIEFVKHGEVKECDTRSDVESKDESNDSQESKRKEKIDDDEIVVRIKNCVVTMKEFTIVMGIVNAMRDNRVSHGLLYHNRCENALAVQLFILELVKLMNLEIDVLRIEAKKHDTKAREGIFRKYRSSKKSLILSVRTIVEGINLRMTDMTAIVDPIHSSVRIVQVAGRSARTFDYRFDVPVQVKKFQGKIDMQSLPNDCHLDDIIVNCSDDENDNAFELRIVNAKSGLVKRDDDEPVPKDFKIISRKKTKSYMYLSMLEDEDESVEYVRRTIGKMIHSQEKDCHEYFANFVKVKSLSMYRSQGESEDFEGEFYRDVIMIESKDILERLEKDIDRVVLDLTVSLRRNVTRKWVGLFRDLATCSDAIFNARYGASGVVRSKYPIDVGDGVNTYPILWIPGECLVEDCRTGEKLKIGRFVSHARYQNSNKTPRNVIRREKYVAEGFFEKDFRKRKWVRVFHDIATCSDAIFNERYGALGVVRSKYSIDVGDGVLIYPVVKISHNVVVEDAYGEKHKIGSFVSGARSPKNENWNRYARNMIRRYVAEGFLEKDFRERTRIRLFRDIATCSDEVFNEKYAKGLRVTRSKTAIVDDDGVAIYPIVWIRNSTELEGEYGETHKIGRFVFDVKHGNGAKNTANVIERMRYVVEGFFEKGYTLSRNAGKTPTESVS
eukprot:g889.t1